MGIMADKSPKRPRPIAIVFFVACLVVLQAFLYASDYFGWFAFNHRPGWTPAIAMLVVGLWVLCFLSWVVASRLLRNPTQFGLGSLLTVVAAVTLPCAWLAQEVRHARQEGLIVASIEAEGGRVDRPDYDYPPTPFDRLLFLSFGDDFVRPVWEVELKTTRNLNRLEGLRHLRSVDLDETSATNADVRQVVHLTDLNFLSLNGTQVTDEGLKDVGKAQGLLCLYLDRTAVTDHGLKNLWALKDLKVLSLDETRVTEEGRQRLNEHLPEIGFLGIDFVY
jgi:hypothetical protein